MKKIFLHALVAISTTVTISTAAIASNSWNNYHWASQSSPVILQVVDSVTADWQAEFDNSLSAWNQSNNFNMIVTSANDSNNTRKRCKMVLGQMRVCNAAYGFNGWLGIASIYIDSSGHITQGTAKVNDSYSSYWADPAEKNHVMCQEIGHVLGLDHTSTDGSSQQTCMDYSQDINSQWPNAHDYYMLDNIIYDHLDGYTTTSFGVSEPCRGQGCNSPSGASEMPMGFLIHRGKKHEIWVASAPDGGLLIHHVLLAPEKWKKS